MTRAWSHKDPTIHIAGRDCTLDVAAWAEAPDHDFSNFCTGPIDLLVSYPSGVTHTSTIPSGDTGWGGHGYNIHFAVDSSLHTGSDSYGSYAEIAVVATVPANLDTNGHEWNMQLVATPATAGRTDDTQLFRSNEASNPARVRV